MRNFCRIVVILAALFAALTTAAFAADGVVTAEETIGGGAAKVVYVDMTDGRWLEPAVANDSAHTDANVSDIIASVSPGEVVAAINAGFFNPHYDTSAPLDVNTGNYPRSFNTVVEEGRVVFGGGIFSAVGQTYDGEVCIDRITLNATVTLRGSNPVKAWSVNVPHNDDSAVYILTDAMDFSVNIPSTFTVATISGGVVTSVGRGTQGYVTPDGVAALVYGPTAWANAVRWSTEPLVGDPAVLGYAATPEDAADTDAWNNMRTIVGGGGVLVQNGVNTSRTNTNITAASLQPDSYELRSFVAQLDDGRLMFGSVYGTFAKIADSLIAMGAVDAIFMDGGTSTMLYASGEYLTTSGYRLTNILTVVDGGSEPEYPEKPVPLEPNTAASDIPSPWALDAVERARENGVLPSNLDGKFRRDITRREFCDLIAAYFRAETSYSLEYYCSLNGIEVDLNRFPDPEGAGYYAPYIAALGIITGYEDGYFRPLDNILRQDAAIILQRLAAVIGAAEGGTPKDFHDRAQIHDYAKPGVDFCSSLGIMNGDADGHFRPRDTLTREEAVITVMNAFDKLEYIKK